MRYNKNHKRAKHSMLLFSAYVAACICFGVSLLWAEQQLFWLGTDTWDKDSKHSEHFHKRDGEVFNPPNWNNPDFYHGDILIRFEVTDKADNTELNMQWCLWYGAGQQEMCMTSRMKFSTLGVYYYRIRDPATLLYIDKDGSGRGKWTGEDDVHMILFQLRKGNKELKTCSESKCLGPEALQYMPITWNSQAYIVSKGSKFEGPTDERDTCSWANAPAEWGWSAEARPAVYQAAGNAQNSISVSHRAIAVTSDSEHRLSIYSINGKFIKAFKGKAAAEYSLPSHLRSTAMLIRAVVDGKTFSNLLFSQ